MAFGFILTSVSPTAGCIVAGIGMAFEGAVLYFAGRES